MEEEFDFDFTSATAVKDFLATQDSRQKKISEYALEYSGSDDGRKLRDLQIGKREDYTQGSKPVKAERIKVQQQKKIVNTAVSFLFGDAPSITANDMNNTSAIEILDVYKKNRISNKLQDFAESVMSTTIGVFIFSMLDDKQIKSRFYTTDNGKYTPQYDVYGDLVAFYWQFVIGEVEHIWIFTDTEIHKYEDEKYQTSDAHEFGVIPVVFVEQEEPEWFIVKEMIDRYEMLKSKLAGSNNYFAFPILKLKGGTVVNKDGEDETLIDVTDDGKSLLLGHAIHNNQVIQADADFLQRDSAAADIKLEKEWLKEDIHSISQTPDLSFDNVKGIGALSGRALELMLQDAINKAKRKRGAYDTAISRILSVIKSGLDITDDELTFDIEFNYSIPQDIAEEIQMLYNATGGKATMSQETAVQHNPKVKNPSEELEKIKAEGVRNLGETFNVG
ncbi:phage portal protein [Leeuwenhoekiella sp. MAR_2009_132]|uniref:phage portal protein n=1 Tax=Leeuwenhoekiella sp. MAR_2009_132 TaxID=1392489 RepID=UPI000491DAD0|nr:phage portal protein [Leeuwenhoekiella sp. MAR_2009_132]